MPCAPSYFSLCLNQGKPVITTEAIAIALKPFFSSVDCPAKLKSKLVRDLLDIYDAVMTQDPDKASEKMANHLGHFEDHFFNHSSEYEGFKTPR